MSLESESSFKVNFVLAGGTKASSSSLYVLFRQHPEVLTSAVKEPHFFSQGLFGTEYRGLGSEIRKVELYEKLFPLQREGKIVGDFDPLTLHGPVASELLAWLNPDAKILLLLRNPVDRAYSHYLMDVRECLETRPFEMAVEEDFRLLSKGSDEYCPIVRLGFYSKYIDKFIGAFGRKNVHVWLYDEFQESPGRVVNEMCTAIGIDPAKIGDIGSVRENEAGIPRNRIVALLLAARFKTLRTPHRIYVKLAPQWIRRYIRKRLFFKRIDAPEIPPAGRARLGEIYQEDIMKLGKLIGKDLTGWLRNPLGSSSLPEHIQKAKQAEFFDEAADEEFEIERPKGTGRLYTWSIDKKFRSALKLLSFPIKGSKLLDICCGSGMAAEYYANAGAEVTGLDISTRSIGRAEERAKRHAFNATFITGDAEKLPFEDGTFDVVTVHDGLHHLPNPHKALEEMFRVAKKAVVIIEPARSWLTAQAVAAGLSLDYEDAGNFVYRFREGEVFQIASRFSFTRQSYRQYLLYYRHEPFKALKTIEKTPLFYVVPAFFWFWSLVAPRLGNKIAVVCEKPGPS